MEEENVNNFKEEFDEFIEKSRGEIESLKTQLKSITDLYNDFIENPDPTSLSKAEKLNNTFEKVQESSSEINDIKTRVQDFETKIFGKYDDDEDTLNFKLNKLKSDLEKTHNDWQKKFDTLSNKIEGLLPGATSAGLAKSYHEQKKSYQTPNTIWAIVFILTMCGMIYYAVLTASESENITKAFFNILSRIPFFIPTIWLALFASKQQSQNRRLEQEYAYKESLAKSYEGYKREIEKLPDSDEKNNIMEKLVGSMILAAEFNPSSTLEKASHNDKPPFFGDFLRSKSQKIEEEKK